MKESYKKRSIFFINKYQRRIILPFFVPSFVVCISVTFLLVMYRRELYEAIVYFEPKRSLVFINQSCDLVLIVTWILFSFITIWAFTVSSKLVGASERILRELDEIIEGKRKETIKVRAKDDLPNELVKRVNILIEREIGRNH